MQQPSSIERVQVFRPPEHTIGPLFKGELQESAIQRVRLELDALSFDEQRASFSYRNPGLGLVQSNRVFMDCSWLVKAPGKFDFRTQSGPLVQRKRGRRVQVNVTKRCSIRVGAIITNVGAAYYSTNICIWIYF